MVADKDAGGHMDLSFGRILIVLLAGFGSGVVNTLAGGGSFLTLAALDLTGLPVATANGTNRLAVLIGDILAALGFRSKGLSSFRLSLNFAIPALFGAILGAYVIIDVPDVFFRRFLGVAMLVMLAILIINPKKWLEGRDVELTPARRALAYLVFFVVGIYGGAIQAGVGFLWITALVLMAGVDLVVANMHKVFIIGVYTLFALLTFALRGHVHWWLGLVLSAGYSVGAWLTSRAAVERGQGFVRLVLAVALVVLSIRYLGLMQF